jgi:cell division septation protein DedD
VDTQLKQRLTGAVILVVLAVVLVPELLHGSGTHNAPAPAVAAAAPVAADDAPVRSYDIDLSDKRAAAPLEKAPATAAPSASPPPAPAPTPTPAPAPAAAPTPAPAAAVAARPVAAPPVAAAPAAARAAPPAAASAAPGADRQRYVLQLGSFAARASADRLATELRHQKFAAVVAPVTHGGRTLYRVRIGPALPREAAQAAARRVASAGHTATLVKDP